MSLDSNSLLLQNNKIKKNKIYDSEFAVFFAPNSKKKKNWSSVCSSRWL